jgi:hypothetical protein
MRGKGSGKDKGEKLFLYQTEYMRQSSEWAKRPATANSNEF